MQHPRLVIAGLVGALAFYFGLIGYRGLDLINQPGWIERVLGGAVLVLPLIGIWVVLVELRFGRQAQKLAGDPGEIARRPAGRVDRDAADLVFDHQRAAVKRDPGDWRGRYRLAEAYDIAGDRRRAREALRTALERHDRVPGYQ